MKQIKSKERVKDNGEVFTNKKEVNAMLDLVNNECERLESRFLEPACGNGNFLVEVLERKLKVAEKRYKKSSYEYEIWSLVAVMSIYGVDLMQDNIDECIERLMEVYRKYYKKVCKSYPDDELNDTIHFVLKHNILQGNALTMIRDDNKPIIFAQWDKVSGDKFKRQDYRLDELISGQEKYIGKKEQTCLDLFDDEEDSNLKEWHYDEETKGYLPNPLKTYPLVNYRRLKDND